jgi:tetratricopeptide (TPR) repeat protein
METNMYYIEELFLCVDKLFSANEYAEGKKVLENILEDEPGYGRAHNHLGWLYFAKFSDYKKAKYHLELAIKFSPDYPPGYLNYTYLLNHLNDYEAVLAHTEIALKVAGVNLYIINSEIGRAYEVHGHYSAADKAYKDAMRHALDKEDMQLMETNIERVKTKNSLFRKKSFFF